MRVKLETLHKCLFYGSFALMSVARFFPKVSLLSNLLDILSLVSAALSICILILLRKYKKKDFLLPASILLVGIINASIINDFELIRLGILLLTFGNLNTKKLIKFDILLKLSIIGIAYFLYSLNIAPDIVMFEDGMQKHSYGFANPNSLAAILFMLSIEFFYINIKSTYRKKNKILIFLAIQMVSIFLVKTITGSRSCILLEYLLTVIGGLYIILPKANNTVSALLSTTSKYSFYILTFMTIIMAFLYGNQSPIAQNINNLLSGRLMWIKTYLDYYGLSIFGKPIIIFDHVTNLNGQALMCLDNVYAYILLKFGLVAWILLGKVFSPNNRKDNSEIQLITILLLLFGFTEASIVKPQFNPFLFFRNTKHDD